MTALSRDLGLPATPEAEGWRGGAVGHLPARPPSPARGIRRDRRGWSRRAAPRRGPGVRAERSPAACPAEASGRFLPDGDAHALRRRRPRGTEGQEGGACWNVPFRARKQRRAQTSEPHAAGLQGAGTPSGASARTRKAKKRGAGCPEAGGSSGSFCCLGRNLLLLKSRSAGNLSRDVLGVFVCGCSSWGGVQTAAPRRGEAP